MLDSIIDYVGNPEFLVRLYQILLVLVVMIHTLFFFRSGLHFKKDTNYYFFPPFPFIRRLPTLMHNAILILLPITGIIILSSYVPLVVIGCFLSAVFLFYLGFFCYSAWHHDIFLSVTIFFLSGMYFAFSQPTIPNPFMTLIIFQMSVLYFFTGLSKLNSKLLKSRLFVEILFQPYRKFFLRKQWLIQPFTSLIALSELFLGFAFWLPIIGLQKLGIIFGTLLHIGMVIMTGRGRTFHTMLPAVYLLVILKNFGSYGNEIVWFILLILLPSLATFLFYSPYNLTVKEYSNYET